MFRLIVIALLLSSCSAQWHLDKAVSKDPSITDTSYVDTSWVDSMKYIDTVSIHYTDTIYVNYLDEVTIEGKTDTVSLNKDSIFTENFFIRRIGEYIEITSKPDTVTVKGETETIIDTVFTKEIDTTLKDTIQFTHPFSTITSQTSTLNKAFQLLGKIFLLILILITLKKLW